MTAVENYTQLKQMHVQTETQKCRLFDDFA